MSSSMRVLFLLVVAYTHSTPSDGLSAMEVPPDVCSVKITSGTHCCTRSI